jgi:hypothetical protein
VGSRAAADNDRKWADLPCFLLPFPSLLAVRTTVTCKGKNTHAKLPILFPLFFYLLSLVFSFWFSVLPFCRWRTALRSGRLCERLEEGEQRLDSVGAAVWGLSLETAGSAGAAGGRRRAGGQLQKMKKSGAPALPCGGWWLTGEDSAAAAGDDKRLREM